MVVQLKLPANERLQFLAGQYIEFLLKGGERRSFSMANAPHADELIELHIRHVAGGKFTDHVFGKMKERDILRLEGPLGSFFLREDSAKPIVFVRIGTGFAPIKSIIESAFHKRIERPMTLYWGSLHDAPHDALPSTRREQMRRAGSPTCPRMAGRAQRLRASRGDAAARLSGTRSMPAACRSWWIGATADHRRSAAAGGRVLRATASPPGRPRSRLHRRNR